MPTRYLLRRILVLFISFALLILVGLPTMAQDLDFLNGTWVGSYFCNQGITRLNLVITATSADAIEAVFNFSAHPDNPDVPSGSFTMKGTYDNETSILELDADEWIEQPAGYVTVDLSGTLSNNNTIYSGEVFGPGCSSFEVTRGGTTVADCFSDEFSETLLSPGWTWVDPLADSNYSLSENPGSLRVVTPDGHHDLHPSYDTNAPRLTQAISSDFDVTTKVTVSPIYTYQAAGLLAWFDEHNFVFIDRGTTNSIEMRYMRASMELQPPSLRGIANTTVYLRIVRNANTFSTYYSLNGSEWTLTGSIDYPSGSPTASVGLFILNNWQDNPLSADFDYFRCAGDTSVFSISGRVTNDSGGPIEGVTVSDGAGHTDTTDANGNYTLAGLPAGTYTLIPTKSDYSFSPPTSAPITVPPDRAQDFVGTLEQNPDPGKPTIVFVHGWNGISFEDYGSCSWPEPNIYFAPVYDEIELTDRYNVKSARLETSPCYTPSIEDNVWRLDNAIQQAKQETGQSKVILVAHSMGGLVSRAYIEGDGYDNDVSALFTFGSPHFGIPLDVFTFLTNGLSVGALCNVQPGACDMSTLGMTLFNQEHQPRNTGTNNVAYHLITGRAPFFTRNPIGMAMDYIIPGLDDGITPEYSGLGQLGPLSLSGTIDRDVTDEVHAQIFGARSYFMRDGGLSVSYDQCLKKVLIGGAIACGDTTTVKSADEPSAVPTTRSSIEQGTLLPGQTVTRTLPLEGTATLFAARWQTGTLALHLIDPSGNPIDSVYAFEHPDVVLYQANSLGASYFFTDTIAGAWKMVLRAATAPTEGSNYTTFAAFDSAVTLTAGTDQRWYEPGATATITASLTPITANTLVTATIYRSDSITDVVSLSPLGGGLYQSTFAVPMISGYAEARIRVTGTTSEGIGFERGASQFFQVTSTRYTLSGSYIEAPYRLSPSSQFYSGIAITVGVSAEISGSIGLSADLIDSESNFVAHSFVSLALVAGTNMLSLQFSGDSIFTSERNGPYTLTNVLLTDKRGASIVAAEAHKVHVTAPYSYRQFGPLGAIYLPLIER